MAAFFQFLPLTSMPCFFSCATAAFARSSRYAPDGVFLITLNCFAILAVWSNAALSMIPMPFAFGQMSALISFICHVWWPFSNVGPWARTAFTQSFAWSRHQIQPLNDAARNFFAIAWWFLSEIHLSVVKMPSSSIPVPAFCILITFRSLSFVSLPVFGFFVSSTCASSLYVIADAEST